ncbi:MAG: hypothetical protein KDB79_05585, partial [Acidobacteria bacterium]|nr:hypothetical protein [Acidobacteriota bacterium]
LFGIIVFYMIERYLLSERLEEANPETILKLEEKIHHIEEKLHIGNVANRVHRTGDRKPDSSGFETPGNPPNTEERESESTGTAKAVND